MDNNNSPRRSGRLNLILIVLMFVVWGWFLFFVVPSPKINNVDYLPEPLATETGISLQEVLKMGKQELEHEDLLFKIREDLKIPPGEEIKIFLGPYLNISGEGMIVASNHPFGFILLLDRAFYQSLTPEEKIALISHELGHLTNDFVFLGYGPDIIIRFQIEADTYATKYARPEAIISVLNKSNIRHGGSQSRQHVLRIQNLERIRQLRQGQ